MLLLYKYIYAVRKVSKFGGMSFVRVHWTVILLFSSKHVTASTLDAKNIYFLLQFMLYSIMYPTIIIL